MTEEMKENMKLATHVVFETMKHIEYESTLLTNMLKQYSSKDPPAGPMNKDIQCIIARLQQHNIQLAIYEGIQAEYRMYERKDAQEISNSLC